MPNYAARTAKGTTVSQPFASAMKSKTPESIHRPKVEQNPVTDPSLTTIVPAMNVATPDDTDEIIELTKTLPGMYFK